MYMEPKNEKLHTAASATNKQVNTIYIKTS